VEDRVAGLTAGGDDYVTKPFSLEEVVARLRACCAAAAPPVWPESSSSWSSATWCWTRTATRSPAPATRSHLTATEFELLRYLMRNPKRVLSKAQILDRVWNYDFGGQANVVELYISYLRKKIDAGPRPR
jgi:two-component system OmpR family response regulator